MSNRTRIAAAIAAIVAAPALAQNVKVTPLGSQAGEFCPQDLSLIHISEPRDRSLSRMPSSA